MRTAFITHVLWAVCINQVALPCNVTVNQPWPMPYLLLPTNSSVDIYCRTNSLFWAVNLVSDTNPIHLRTDIAGENQMLRMHGVYKLDSVIETPGMPPTLRLRINNTSVNNGTDVVCAQNETRLSIYNPMPLNVEVVDIDKDGINISWSEESMFTASNVVGYVYLLTITNGSNRVIVSLNESYYNLRAPSNAPPCEVYNFSVTATPVGATYTGDGCSVPSPVVSRMLPSLPDIKRLESTLHYSLVYESDPIVGFVLSSHFMSADFCTNNSVTDYIMEVKGSLTFITKLATSTNDTAISINNLPENCVYTVCLIISSAEGNVSTNSRTIYTTDVQNVTVTAVPIETTNVNTLMIQCYFVNGSTAEGCMVVLVGEHGNTTVNLTRDNSHKTIITSLPLSCYTGVFGYDIESDGSVGTLAVPGVISNTRSGSMCNLPPKQNAPSYGGLVGGIFAAIVALIALITFCVIIVFHKRSHRQIGIDKSWNGSSTKKSDSSPDADNEDTEVDEAVPVYDEPLKQVVSIRTAGDGADHSNQYNSTTHTQESPDKADDVNKGASMYAELSDGTEHFYHVLESSRPPKGVKVPPPADDILLDEDAPPLPPPFIPDQEPQPPPLPPAYQDITCLTSRDSEAVVNGIDT